MPLLPLVLTAADDTQTHDVAGVVAVLCVFVVMLALFGVLIWLAFRAARRGRATWADDQSGTHLAGPGDASAPVSRPVDGD